MSGTMSVSGSNNTLLPCVRTMIHSYNDDRFIGFIVNIKATVTSATLQQNHDFSVGDNDWTFKIRIEQDLNMTNINKSDGGAITAHYHFALKYGNINGIIHQITNYSNGCVSNIWKVSDLRSWTGGEVKKINVTLPFSVNAVLRYRKDFVYFDGCRSHFLMDHCKVVDDMVDLEFSKPDYVILKGNGWDLHVRKHILTTASPVFRAMFSHDMKESQENSVNVSDLSQTAVKAMLTFMYSGKLTLNDESTVYDLCRAADIYCIDALKLACDQELSVNLTEDNIIDRMITAVSFKLPLACAICSTFIRENYKTIIMRDDWEELAGHKDTIFFVTRRMALLGCPSMEYKN